MKKQLVTELLTKSLDATRPENVIISLSQEEIERLIANVVDRCITVMEAEMDAALANDNAELYATLVDIAFKTMDEFGIDELGELSEQEIEHSIEQWGLNDKRSNS